MDYDDEVIKETIDVLHDESFLKRLMKSIQEAKQGKLFTLEQVKRKLHLQ